MDLRGSDYLLVRLAQFAAPLLRRLGDVETECLRGRLDCIPVRKPVFLTGLARSGTTILLQELCAAAPFATHRYRDFPFLMTPVVWNRLLGRLSREEAPVPRPHNDRITITRESAEAFEEPLWQYFFPHVHFETAVHRLIADDRNELFERFFREHMQKILLLRGGERYLSKGNYNVTRIEYLANVFPDAQFVIPVRNPVTHVDSLVRQHRRFTEFAKTDRRVPKYLASAGHYEFGPQRVPIRLSAEEGDRTLHAWRRGEEHRGYAIQWAQVYRFVEDLRARDSDLRQRIQVVRYEDFCRDPRGTLRSILNHAEIKATDGFSQRSFQSISASSSGDVGSESDYQAAIWDETESVAAGLGYRRSESESPKTPAVVG